MVVEFTKTIAINACVSSNPAHGEVCSMQHYVIKFVNDLRQVGGFLRVLRFLHQYNWPPRYGWNIVKSGATHHKPKLITSEICFANNLY